MTSAALSSGTKTGSAIESMMQFWMLPAQLMVGFMESMFTAMMHAVPVSPVALHAERTSDERQEIAREAEEQAAHIDDAPGDTVLNPASLVA